MTTKSILQAAGVTPRCLKSSRCMWLEIHQDDSKNPLASCCGETKITQKFILQDAGVTPKMASKFMWHDARETPR